MQQVNLFDCIYEKYKVKKPILLIELFAGYGSQNLGLKYINADYKHYRICEWATKSIQAYNDLHIRDYTDYSQLCTFEQVANYLHKKGISMNYNEPMTFEQIKRKGEKWCRTTYNNIVATHNLVNIQQVHGRDLGITDIEENTYLLTYSFPCQDLSLAGKSLGFAKGSGTRSGMLWEVERILNECAELGKLPQILMMENVTQIHNKENMPHFQEWIKALEKLGYQSYWQDLNAKDYGIPQNRDRTFMVSILGDYYYEFPKKMPLKLILKDMLEDEVDEKYYLSEKMIEYILNRTPLGEKGNYANNLIGNDFVKNAGTITTKGSSSGTSVRGGDNLLIDNMTQEEIDKYIYLKENKPSFEDVYNKLKKSKFEQEKNRLQEKEYCDTLLARDCKGPKCVIVPEATKKGYAEAYEGDGVYINRPHQKRGVVQKGLIQTLKTSCDDVGVVVKVGNYSPSGHNASSIVDSKGIAPTVMENHGTVTAVVENDGNPICLNSKGGRGGVEGLQPSLQNRVYSSSSSVALTTGFHPSYTDKDDLRIRKLTPRTCGRLMGVKDEDIDKMAENQSDSSLYHLFGDSIVVNVLSEIFKKLLEV